MLDISTKEIQSAISRLQHCDERTTLRLTGYLMVAAHKLRQRVADFRKRRRPIPSDIRRDIEAVTAATGKQHKLGVNLADAHNHFMTVTRF